MPLEKIRRFSHIFIWAVLLLVGLLNLGTPFLTILFSSLALKHFAFREKKWISVTLFLLLVAAIFEGFVLFMQQAIVALPQIANTSIPKLAEYSLHHGVQLGFDDMESMKAAILESLRDQLGYLANFAKIATKEFVFLIVGLVVAISMYLTKKIDLGEPTAKLDGNMYSVASAEIVRRFSLFFSSFETVLGAQIIISLINSFFTAIFAFWVALPYAPVAVVITFLCGMLPVIGNLISNSIITGIAITVSPNLAVACLGFLIVLHKLEYFLNSKIIGSRIKNPMWLTLLALLIGEKLAGIPGMILAPVILHYIKSETSSIRIEPV